MHDQQNTKNVRRCCAIHYAQNCIQFSLCTSDMYCRGIYVVTYAKCRQSLTLCSIILQAKVILCIVRRMFVVELHITMSTHVTDYQIRLVSRNYLWQEPSYLHMWWVTCCISDAYAARYFCCCCCCCCCCKTECPV